MAWSFAKRFQYIEMFAMCSSCHHVHVNLYSLLEHHNDAWAMHEEISLAPTMSGGDGPMGLELFQDKYFLKLFRILQITLER